MLSHQRPLVLKRPYEPKPRFSHYAGVVGGKPFIFGGRTAHFDKAKEELSSTVEVFDQYLEQWRQLKTTGSPPKGLYSGGCCVSSNGDLYVYGGSDGSTLCGGLCKLTFLDLNWSQLMVDSDVNCPRRKSGCRMVFFKNKKLAIIGGYGPPPASLQPGATFIRNKHYSSRNGWTNEVCILEIGESKLYISILLLYYYYGYHGYQVRGPPLPSVVLGLLQVPSSP